MEGRKPEADIAPVLRHLSRARLAETKIQTCEQDLADYEIKAKSNDSALKEFRFSSRLKPDDKLWVCTGNNLFCKMSVAEAERKLHQNQVELRAKQKEATAGVAKGRAKLKQRRADYLNALGDFYDD